MPSRDVCPVCKGEDADCAFCMGLGTVSGAWRESFQRLLDKGTWTARILTDRGVVVRVVRREDIR